MAHGLVAAGVSFNLGAIHRDGAQLDQAHLARQSHDLDKQVSELGQVQCAKVADGAVGWKVVGTQHPKRNILMQLLGDLARTEDPGGIGIDQDFDQHDRMKRLVA